MHWFHKFILAWNSTCFGQFLCPSSGVYSLYTQQWFVDSFRAGPSWSCSKAVFRPVWHISLLSVEWINSWWWAEELSEKCRVSCQNKFGKLVHLVGFIIKKIVTMHGHVTVNVLCSIYVRISTSVIDRLSSVCLSVCLSLFLSLSFCRNLRSTSSNKQWVQRKSFGDRTWPLPRSKSSGKEAWKFPFSPSTLPSLGFQPQAVLCH